MTLSPWDFKLEGQNPLLGAPILTGLPWRPKLSWRMVLIEKLLLPEKIWFDLIDQKLLVWLELLDFRDRQPKCPQRTRILHTALKSIKSSSKQTRNLGGGECRLMGTVKPGFFKHHLDDMFKTLCSFPYQKYCLKYLYITFLRSRWWR